MAEKWFNSNFKNIQFKQHPTRKHGVKPDRYFRGSYQVSGIRKAINFGWESEGWAEADAYLKIEFFKKNAKTGIGPLSPKEEREIKVAEKAEAEKVAAEIKKSIITFKDFFHEIYFPSVTKEKKPETYRHEESHFRIWLEPRIGAKLFKKISKAHIEGIFYDIVDEAGKSIRTAEYVLTTLKQIWREAKAGGYAPDMPVMSKALRKRISGNNNARQRFLSHDEAEILLIELKKHSLNLYEKALMSLHCGLRASEIFDLTWSHVDLEHGILNISDSKSKDRNVHMSEQVKEMMVSKTKGGPGELVWPGKNNRASEQISQVFRQVVDRLFNKGIKDRRQRVTFHSLRHSCASWMVMQGISLYLVQKVLGHSTIQMTERYSHLAPDQLALAAKTFNQKNPTAADQIKALEAEIERLKNQNTDNVIPFKKEA